MSNKKTTHRSRPARTRGASLVEFVILLPITAFLGLGVVQAGLIYTAKNTLNLATFEAARAGSMHHAQKSAMRQALTRGLVPLHGGGTTGGQLSVAYLKAGESVNLYSRIEILNPTQEAFDDYAIDLDGQRQIPNDHLQYRARAVGTRSTQTIQDANLLKIRITYGYPLTVPVVGKLIIETARFFGATSPDPVQQALLAQNRLPIVAATTLRMQTPAYPDGNASSTGAAGTPGPGGGGSLPDDPADPAPADPGQGGGDVADGGDANDPLPDDEDVALGDPQSCGADTAAAAQPVQVASLSVGNPINVVTGNKYQRETDMSRLPGTLGLELVRHYNSRSRTRGPLGAGWTHGYQVSLAELDRDALSVRQADGRVIVFHRDAKTERFLPVVAADGEIRRDGEITVWHRGDGGRLDFDPHGQLWRIHAAGGETLSLSHDRNGRLLTVTDPQSRTLSFDYYPNGRIKRVLDPAGKPIGFTYDQHGNLAGVSYADGTTRRYHYEDANDPHNLTGITDGRGIRYATWAYDEKDRAILSTHADDVGKVTLAFNKDHTVVTDSLGKPSIYRTARKSGLPVVTAVEGPGCGSCGGADIRYTYNDRLQLVAVTGRDRVTTVYDYDRRGRLQRVLQRAPGAGERTMMRYEYDGDSARPHRIARPSVAPGREHIVELTYDDGRLIWRSESGWRPDGTGKYHPIVRNLHHRYQNGRLAAVDGPLVGPGDTIYIDYDARGYVDTVRRPEGLTERIEQRDAYGRVLRLRDPDGVATRLAYNIHGQVTAMTRGSQRYKIAYGPEGHPGRVERPDGSAYTADYDAAGRLEWLKDADGNLIRWRRDTEDRVRRVEVHDSDGRLALGQALDYDVDGRLTQTRLPDGSGSRYHYDDLGRLRAVADALGHTTAYALDAFGQLRATVAAAESGKPVATRFERDAHGRRVALTDARGNTTREEYDDFGNKVLEASPDRGLRLYRHDEAGRVIAIADERAVIHTYEYDYAGRPKTAALARATRGVTYSYAGTRLARVASEHESTDYDYDAEGRLTLLRQTLFGRAFVTRYHYDAAGRLTEKTLPDGQVLVHRYDARTGRLTEIARRDWLKETPVVRNIGYRPFGPVAEYTHGNGIATRIGYTTAGRIETVEAGAVLKVKYDYDAATRIRAITRNGIAERYDYDRLQRLAAAKIGQTEFGYGYDDVGNRKTYTVNGETTRYDYDPHSNRLISMPDAQVMKVSYLATGEPLGFSGRRYEYGPGGRPVRAYAGDAVVAYGYNAQGERIRKTVHRNGEQETTFYLYENQRLVGEADAAGKLTAYYLYLDQRPVAKLEGRNIYHLHPDHLGTPQAVTDAKAQVVWRAAYEPFGRAHVAADPDGDGKAFTLNLRFPGQYHDAETGTHYNYLRDYDPGMGRYLTGDPLGVEAGANAYLYASANPVERFDVYGTYDVIVHYYMTFFLAKVAGLNHREALTVAQAAQYIDDNLYTDPFPNATGGGNRDARERYHFTFTQNEINAEANAFSSNLIMRFQNSRNDNTQLAFLRMYATSAQTPCAKFQFYGEYLHGLQDSFAHRNHENVPFGPGGGHAVGSAGTDPDRTYDVPNTNSLLFEPYLWNDEKAILMEEVVFQRFQADFKRTAKTLDGKLVTFDDVRDTLIAFNTSTDNRPYAENDRIAELRFKLAELDLGDIPEYSASDAREARARNLNGLDPRLYPRAILDTPNR